MADKAHWTGSVEMSFLNHRCQQPMNGLSQWNIVCHTIVKIEYTWQLVCWDSYGIVFLFTARRHNARWQTGVFGQILWKWNSWSEDIRSQWIGLTSMSIFILIYLFIYLFIFFFFWQLVDIMRDGRQGSLGRFCGNELPNDQKYTANEMIVTSVSIFIFIYLSIFFLFFFFYDSL